MRMNPLQIGFSITMGWIIGLLVCTAIQSIINLGGEEMFWVMLILGLGVSFLPTHTTRSIESGVWSYAIGRQTKVIYVESTNLMWFTMPAKKVFSGTNR